MYNVDFSLTNGLGKPAVSIYYSGCDIPVKCKDCHNPELWQPSKPKVGNDELYRLIRDYYQFDYSDQLRIAFLGGDPLASYNRESVVEVAAQLKKDFPDAELIIYSWRLPEEIEDEWVENFDLGVLGQFEIGEYKENYLPASTNQIIYDFRTKEIMQPIKLREEKEMI